MNLLVPASSVFNVTVRPSSPVSQTSNNSSKVVPYTPTQNDKTGSPPFSPIARAIKPFDPQVRIGSDSNVVLLTDKFLETLVTPLKQLLIACARARGAAPSEEELSQLDPTRRDIVKALGSNEPAGQSSEEIYIRRPFDSGDPEIKVRLALLSKALIDARIATAAIEDIADDNQYDDSYSIAINAGVRFFMNSDTSPEEVMDQHPSEKETLKREFQKIESMFSQSIDASSQAVASRSERMNEAKWRCLLGSDIASVLLIKFSTQLSQLDAIIEKLPEPFLMLINYMASSEWTQRVFEFNRGIYSELGFKSIRGSFQTFQPGFNYYQDYNELRNDIFFTRSGVVELPRLGNQFPQFGYRAWGNHRILPIQTDRSITLGVAKVFGDDDIIARLALFELYQLIQGQDTSRQEPVPSGGGNDNFLHKIRQKLDTCFASDPALAEIATTNGVELTVLSWWRGPTGDVAQLGQRFLSVSSLGVDPYLMSTDDNAYEGLPDSRTSVFKKTVLEGGNGFAFGSRRGIGNTQIRGSYLPTVSSTLDDALKSRWVVMTTPQIGTQLDIKVMIPDADYERNYPMDHVVAQTKSRISSDDGYIVLGRSYGKDERTHGPGMKSILGKFFPVLPGKTDSQFVLSNKDAMTDTLFEPRSRRPGQPMPLPSHLSPVGGFFAIEYGTKSIFQAPSGRSGDQFPTPGQWEYAVMHGNANRSTPLIFQKSSPTEMAGVALHTRLIYNYTREKMLVHFAGNGGVTAVAGTQAIGIFASNVLANSTGTIEDSHYQPARALGAVLSKPFDIAENDSERRLAAFIGAIPVNETTPTTMATIHINPTNSRHYLVTGLGAYQVVSLNGAFMPVVAGVASDTPKGGLYFGSDEYGHCPLSPDSAWTKTFPSAGFYAVAPSSTIDAAGGPSKFVSLFKGIKLTESGPNQAEVVLKNMVGGSQRRNGILLIQGYTA